MDFVEILNNNLRNINESVNAILQFLRNHQFNSSLSYLSHIPRDYESTGPMVLDSYELERLDDASLDVILHKIRDSLLPTVRGESGIGANRLVGTIEVDCTSEGELELADLISSLNASKKIIGATLKSEFPDMNKRMKYLKSPTCPLHGVVMDTIKRQIICSPVGINQFIKSATFSWSEKSFKSITLSGFNEFEAHLFHYGGDVYENRHNIFNNNPLSIGESWTTFLPQRIHPVVNISFADIDTKKVIKRWPHKAHTPIFLFSKHQANIKPLNNYLLKDGLKKPDSRFKPVLPLLSLYISSSA